MPSNNSVNRDQGCDVILILNKTAFRGIVCDVCCLGCLALHLNAAFVTELPRCFISVAKE